MAIDIDQSYSKGLMIGLGVLFMIVPTLFTGLRLTAKSLGRKGIGADDWLAVGAWVFSMACCICLIVAAVDGQLGQHQTVGPDGMPLLNDPAFLTYEKTKFATNMLTILGLGLSKLSILLLYIEIFSIRSFKIAAYAMMGLVSVWTVSFFFSNLFTCLPVTALVEPFYGNKCLDSISMWLSSVIIDVILDFAILVMPIPLIATLKLRTAQKLSVVGMFLLGGGICAISIVRLLVYFQIGAQFALHYNDETYYTSPVFFWAVIELGLAVVCAALPTLRPLWLWFFPAAGQTSASRYGSGYGNGSGGRSGGAKSRGRAAKISIFNKGSHGHSQLESISSTRDDVELTAGVHTTIEHAPSNDGQVGPILVERTIEQASTPRAGKYA